MKISSFKAN